jgi:hypothetical protein
VLLTPDLYDDEITKVLTFNGLKKVNKTVCKNDKINGVNHFSVKNNKQTRTFLKSRWNGFKLINNNFYPHGYIDDSKNIEE